MLLLSNGLRIIKVKKWRGQSLTVTMLDSVLSRPTLLNDSLKNLPPFFWTRSSDLLTFIKAGNEAAPTPCKNQIDRQQPSDKKLTQLNASNEKNVHDNKTQASPIATPFSWMVHLPRQPVLWPHCQYWPVRLRRAAPIAPHSLPNHQRPRVK